jgi:hypothetical protein
MFVPYVRRILLEGYVLLSIRTIHRTTASARSSLGGQRELLDHTLDGHPGTKNLPTARQSCSPPERRKRGLVLHCSAERVIGDRQPAGPRVSCTGDQREESVCRKDTDMIRPELTA